MHRDVVTHCLVTKTDFLITGSADGHIKFWKMLTLEYVKIQATLSSYQQQQQQQLSASSKEQQINGPKGISRNVQTTFVKHFRAHLDYQPLTCSWIHGPQDPLSTLAISVMTSPLIYLYDGKNLNVKEPLHVQSKLGHTRCVHLIEYNEQTELVVSCDMGGIVNYWSGKESCQYDIPPKLCQFESKLDTDLFEFIKQQTYPYCLKFSPNGLIFACLTRTIETPITKKKLYLFDTRRGKIMKIYNETNDVYRQLQDKLQQKQQQLAQSASINKQDDEDDVENEQIDEESNKIIKGK
ncbi:unnamed protein product [Didymodactylos carnosus]|uniref:Uncharacterized protein n=1 Tax=Didymodactylos carnosus TaxID=1234261 RepID=A0A8S2SM15_9BILA|nr:unnamed protein product [Didymodactylos carnosus]CAF4231571.1 unnamed protein product [Didymodactylos carnosus]